MRNLYLTLIVLLFVSCTYNVRTSSKYSRSGDTVTVVKKFSSLDTASIKKGVLTYNKHRTRKTDYYVNGVLVKHEESTADTGANKAPKLFDNDISIQNTAFFDEDVHARKSAVAQLKKQSDIQHVAFFDDDVAVRKLAVTMLQNEADIQHVAFFDDEKDIRLLAVSMLKKQENISHVAFFDDDKKVRKLALTMLKNRTDIKHVANFDDDEELRKVAEKLLR